VTRPLDFRRQTRGQARGWSAPDGEVFVGRTQDWTEKANSAFRVYPRGIERTGAVAENPHKWTSKYGSVAVSAYDMGTHEGVNEKGLSAHALYLAVENSFDPRDAKLEGIGIMQWVQYYLDNYATVAEAVEAQKSWAFQIEPLILPNGFPTLVHVSLSDKSGDSAVVEFIGGKARRLRLCPAHSALANRTPDEFHDHHLASAVTNDQVQNLTQVSPSEWIERRVQVADIVQRTPPFHHWQSQQIV
jgi:hypothetical protein